MQGINQRIKNEICRETLHKLSDEILMETYLKCSSVKSNIQQLIDVLNICDIPKDKQDKIINLYSPHLIPAGTKGVIRGNTFNSIVQKHIEELHLPQDVFDVYFEKKHPNYMTSEIPDWYIYHKRNNKILIGMNQLDLWSGGQQINRGSKYIIQEKNNENRRLICVVSNDVQIKSEKSKMYTLFDTGFKNNTLCYLTNLKNIIYEYFQEEIDR